MSALAISLLWFLVGVVILCLVVYVVLWVIKSFVQIVIPPQIEKGVWVIVILLILIWLITTLTGAGPAFHFAR